MTLPDPVLTLVEELGILQNRDLTARGIHPQPPRRETPRYLVLRANIPPSLALP
jgi:hypothetical protein